MAFGAGVIRLRRRLGTVPGLLTAVAAGLVAVGLVFGLVGWLAVQRRTALVRDIGEFSGPLSVQAQQLYRSLSDADATAAAAFLTDGVEPPALRQRYLDDMAQVTSSLSVAQRDADGRGAEALTVLVAQLPIYAGLIETARTYNRQGLPLGGGYLRQASALMRQTLLPAAQALLAAETDRLVAAQRDAAEFPWDIMLLGVVVLAALVAAQVLLTRSTNRVVNPGLAAATLAAALALGWASVALVAAGDRVERGRADGSALVKVLAEARVAAAEARADEALTLIARGDGARYDTEFGRAFDRLVGADGSGGLLGRAHAMAATRSDKAHVAEAQDHARRWRAVHQEVRELDNAGRYVDAVRLAVDPSANTTTGLFTALDTAIGTGIAAADVRFDDHADDAAGVLTGADLAVVLLTGLLVAGAALGMYPRIGEYR